MKHHSSIFWCSWSMAFSIQLSWSFSSPTIQRFPFRDRSRVSDLFHYLNMSQLHNSLWLSLFYALCKCFNTKSRANTLGFGHDFFQILFFSRTFQDVLLRLFFAWSCLTCFCCFNIYLTTSYFTSIYFIHVTSIRCRMRLLYTFCVIFPDYRN